jgi:hypothetical protein
MMACSKTYTLFVQSYSCWNISNPPAFSLLR